MGTQVEKRDLKIGDVVKVSTTIDTRDIADPDSEAANRWVQSVLIDNETHHWSRIRAGESFGRYAVVISKPRDTEEILVVYLATFGRRTSFPTAVDPNFWVPVHPARREGGMHNPIASINEVAQWVSIRRKIPIGETVVST